MTDVTATPTRTSPRRRRTGPRIAMTVLAFLGSIGCCLPVGLRLWVVEAFEIEGPAMEPNYNNGDRVLVEKVSGDPEPGDVIILEAPVDGIDVIKRVIGVGGDRIAVQEGVIIRNGEPVPQRIVGEGTDVSSASAVTCLEETLAGLTYRVQRTREGRLTDEPETTVPEGHLYVVGDHRHRSNDSRYFGPVPLDAVEGKVVTHYLRGDDPSPCTE